MKTESILFLISSPESKYKRNPSLKIDYKIDTDNYELEIIDRMEPCFVTKDEGLNIKTIFKDFITNGLN